MNKISAMNDDPKNSQSINPRKRPNPDPPNFSNPSSLVTFIIGEEEKEFLIHKEFACAASPVFNSAFNGPFMEGQSQKYELEDVTVGEFRFLSQWMYGKSLDVVCLRNCAKVKHDHRKKLETDMANLQEVNDLIGLWVLAGKLLIPRLQNAALCKFAQTIDWFKCFPTQSLEYIYENTSEDSLLRKYVIDEVTWHLAPGCFIEVPHHFSKQMLLDSAVASRTNHRSQRLSSLISCMVSILNDA